MEVWVWRFFLTPQPGEPFFFTRQVREGVFLLIRWVSFLFQKTSIPWISNGAPHICAPLICFTCKVQSSTSSDLCVTLCQLVLGRLTRILVHQRTILPKLVVMWLRSTKSKFRNKKRKKLELLRPWKDTRYVSRRWPLTFLINEYQWNAMLYNLWKNIKY